MNEIYTLPDYFNDKELYLCQIINDNLIMTFKDKQYNKIINLNTKEEVYTNFDEYISTEIENIFTKYPILEPSFLYGGYPFKDLRHKFLMAKPSNPTSDISELPEGLEYIKLGGHFFDMIGIKTSDDVYFLADCVFGENTINKYHISFIYNVEEFLKTLDFIETLEGKLFIPSHAPACEDIKPLVKLNRDKVFEIIDTILNICKEPLIFEDILQKVFIHYELKMDLNQYVLVGNTVKAYLSYLYDNEKLSLEIIDSKLYWKTI